MKARKELAPTTWKKHNGSQVCPEDEWSVIEVETYTACSFTGFAKDLEWEYIKFYRVKEDTGETL